MLGSLTGKRSEVQSVSLWDKTKDAQMAVLRVNSLESLWVGSTGRTLVGQKVHYSVDPMAV